MQWEEATEPSQGAWLTGNQTNHNAKSAILSNKQTRQESRLTSVDLNLKKCVYWPIRCLQTVMTVFFLCVGGAYLVAENYSFQVAVYGRFKKVNLSLYFKILTLFLQFWDYISQIW